SAGILGVEGPQTNVVESREARRRLPIYPIANRTKKRAENPGLAARFFGNSWQRPEGALVPGSGITREYTSDVGLECHHALQPPHAADRLGLGAANNRAGVVGLERIVTRHS